MRPFILEKATSIPGAIGAATAPAQPRERREAVADQPTHYLAGGTTLLDLMKLDVMQPSRLIDINALEQATGAGRIQVHDGGVRLGGLVRMADAIRHPELKRLFPALVQTLESAASPQLRNMATLAGNVLQRTRCNYFRDPSWAACNKRNPGSGCAATEGFNRMHAVLGVSEKCIATYPGDFAAALVMFDATVEIAGPGGERTIGFADLHRQPGATPEIETTLRPGDLITAFTIPLNAWSRRSVYVKVRDRQSYEFALASAAVGLDLDGPNVRDVRIALGGVATAPWRATAAEAALKGGKLDEASALKAADAAFSGARAREHNAFKIPLGKATLVRALLEAGSMEI